MGHRSQILHGLAETVARCKQDAETPKGTINRAVSLLHSGLREISTGFAIDELASMIRSIRADVEEPNEAIRYLLARLRQGLFVARLDLASEFIDQGLGS